MIYSVNEDDSGWQEQLYLKNGEFFGSAVLSYIKTETNLIAITVLSIICCAGTSQTQH